MTDEQVTLADLALDPARALKLDRVEAARMLAQAGAVEALLRARLASVPTANGAKGDRPQPDTEPSRHLLTPAEAARRLGVTTRWLRGRNLPFRVQVSPRRVRYDAAGLDRYVRRKELA